MIQCQDCPHFNRNASGEVRFDCDPFANIVEPECLAKWQLIKTNQMVTSYQATLDYYRKLGPLQEKMFKVMQRELEDMSESEQWKIESDEEEPAEEDDRDDTPKW